jgi:hypothetical protein
MNKKSLEEVAYDYLTDTSYIRKEYKEIDKETKLRLKAMVQHIEAEVIQNIIEALFSILKNKHKK